MIWSSNSTPKEMKMPVHTKTYTQMFTLFILARNWEKNKCPYNWILLSNKKELLTTCNNMEQSIKHHAKWKKPDTKKSVLYNSIYFEFLEKAEQQQTADKWLAGVGKGLTTKGY